MNDTVLGMKSTTNFLIYEHTYLIDGVTGYKFTAKSNPIQLDCKLKFTHNSSSIGRHYMEAPGKKSVEFCNIISV